MIKKLVIDEDEVGAGLAQQQQLGLVGQLKHFRKKYKKFSKQLNKWSKYE